MAFLISLLLILTSTLTNAFTIRQWIVSNNATAVGGSILFNGSKGAVTSSVLVTPTAAQVAKVLRSGGAGFALRLAVEQLLGAVDWVMDPANNQIKYKEQVCISNCAPGVYYYPWNGTLYKTPDYPANQICKGAISFAGYAGVIRIDMGVPLATCYYNASEKGATFFMPIDRVVAERVIEEQEKTLPLETVAQKVIENAQNNNLDAQFAVLAAANNILSEAEKDAAKAKPIEDELERNKDDDICYKEWAEEVADCDVWKGQGSSDDPNRYFRACKERAANRLRICQRTGVPPLEPPPWSRIDIM
ncbi:hypothetical protein [Acinetobacter defluvii]|uniref:hypothetical protein n=1 Tax=Acinetobacter defluvii TaxID=1871111 RepID=UPI003AF64083